MFRSNVCPSTVRRQLSNMSPKGCVAVKKPLLGKQIDKNKQKSTGVCVHPSTVRRQLRDMSLKGCVAVKKPLLGKQIDKNKENLQ